MAMRNSRKGKAPRARSDRKLEASGASPRQSALKPRSGRDPQPTIHCMLRIGVSDMPSFHAMPDGQAGRMTTHPAARHSVGGASPHGLARATAGPLSSATDRLRVVVAAARIDQPRTRGERFVTAHRRPSAPLTPALVRANLTAGRSGTHAEAGSRYRQKSIARHRQKPALATAGTCHRLDGVLRRRQTSPVALRKDLVRLNLAGFCCILSRKGSPPHQVGRPAAHEGECQIETFTRHFAELVGVGWSRAIYGIVGHLRRPVSRTVGVARSAGSVSSLPGGCMARSGKRRADDPSGLSGNEERGNRLLVPRLCYERR